MIQPLHNSPSRLAELDVDAINQLLLTDDWTDLARDERIARYRTLCELLGLEWRWMPLDLWKDRTGRRKPGITARASKQLKVRHGISSQPLSTTFRGGYVVVEVRCELPDGRFSVKRGAVAVDGKTPQERADAEKWAETQADKRATLDLLGIGLPDESEALLVVGGAKCAFDLETGTMTGDSLADALDDDDQTTIERRDLVRFKIHAREQGWRRPESLYLLQSRYGWKHEGAIRKVRLQEVLKALEDRELQEEIRQEMESRQ